MLRTLLLSLLMMLLLTSLFPLSDWASGSTLAYWNKRLAHMHSGRDRAHYGHRHSRAWWHRRRARQRRVRGLAALRRSRAAAAHSEALAASGSNSSAISNPYRAGGIVRDQRSLFNFVLPARWSSQPATHSGEMRFHVLTSDGQPAGTVVLTPIFASSASSNDLSSVPSARLKTLGGVPFSQLRRTVIDRMIAEGGWVTNDMEREIGGHRVYIVLAHVAASSNTGRQLPSQPGPIASRTFYFTEVHGRIYTLATNAPLEISPMLATESEQVVASLHAANDIKDEVGRMK